MRYSKNVLALAMAAALITLPRALAAQTPAYDPSARLQEVLPADVAERVLARIAAAKAVELPAQALENRALKFAARGVAPADIERAINEHADRMQSARGLLAAGRGGRPPVGIEIEAAADALRQGVDGQAVSELAKAAPSGRSLAVPLFVIGSLVERGLPSDEALARVRERLLAKASDEELENLPGVRRGQGELPPQAVGRTGERTSGPPSTVPRNGGSATRPTPTRPAPARRP